MIRRPRSARALRPPVTARAATSSGGMVHSARPWGRCQPITPWSWAIRLNHQVQGPANRASVMRAIPAVPERTRECVVRVRSRSAAASTAASSWSATSALSRYDAPASCATWAVARSLPRTTVGRPPGNDRSCSRWLSEVAGARSRTTTSTSAPTTAELVAGRGPAAYDSTTTVRPPDVSRCRRLVRTRSSVATTATRIGRVVVSRDVMPHPLRPSRRTWTGVPRPGRPSRRAGRPPWSAPSGRRPRSTRRPR